MSRISYSWTTSLATLSDGFCGAGGSSYGAERAGAIVQLAMNHNAKSLLTHEANFPLAQHRIEDIADLDPSDPPHPLMAWWSPECRFHSLSRGKKIKNLDQLHLWECGEFDEAAERSRMSMDQVWRWAQTKAELGRPYQIIFVENVVEVHYWKGFQPWLAKMLSLGYEYKELHLNSMFFDVGQSRNRAYFVFWRKGNRAPLLNFLPRGYCIHCGRHVDCLQCWKNPQRQWGKYRIQYTYNCEYCLREVVPFYTSAASVINWQKPAQKIRERKKPLKEITMQRIRMGIERFCQNAVPTPLLIETCRSQTESMLSRPVEEPCFTQTTSQSMGIASPFVVDPRRSRATNNCAYPVGNPLPTVTSQREKAVAIQPHATPFVVNLSHVNSESISAHSIGDPLSTQTARQDKALLLPSMQDEEDEQIQPFLVSYYSNGKAYPSSEPLCTVSTKARNGLCLPPEGQRYTNPPASSLDMNEWHFRMLDRYEIQKAMGFVSSYQIMATSEREAVRQLGLAVTPAVAQWLVQAALTSLS